MQVHRLLIHAICPIHKVNDHYELTVTSRSTIYVEDIAEFAASLALVEKTQEDITWRIAKRFPGTKVRTVGWHSNVRAVVKAQA